VVAAGLHVGHASTVVGLLAVAVLVVLVIGAAGTQRRRARRSRRTTDGRARSAVLGLVLLGLVLGATATGGAIAHAIVAALAAIGHALVGMLS
jgi:hypothetical protein